jgi:ribonuclease T2
LKSHGKTDVLAYMKTYWKDYQGNDESFWEHEWDKHGTCISTLEPKCYTGYTKQAEVADYFQIATDLFKGLDSYTILANAGVTPSTTKSYALAEIANPLRAYHGYDVTIQCSSSALNEIWYHYNVLGNVQAKNSFVPTSPDGSKGSCPATGIKYTPKYLDTTTPSNPGTTVPFVGKGFLRAYTNGTNQGFLISGGTWYPNSGTPAGYTVATVDNGFTLTTSKGACTAVAGTGLLGCAAGNTASVFSAVNSTLAYRGQTTFYADAVPTGIIQAKVYTVGTSHPVEVSFRWATS